MQFVSKIVRQPGMVEHVAPELGTELSLETYGNRIIIYHSDLRIVGFLEESVAAAVNAFLQHEHPLTVSEMDCRVTGPEEVTIELTGVDEVA